MIYFGKVLKKYCVRFQKKNKKKTFFGRKILKRDQKKHLFKNQKPSVSRKVLKKSNGRFLKEMKKAIFGNKVKFLKISCKVSEKSPFWHKNHLSRTIKSFFTKIKNCHFQKGASE